MRLILSLMVVCLLSGCIGTGGGDASTTLSPTTTIPAKVDCDVLRDKIISGIDDLNVCNQDSDCAMTTYQCPFGCRIYGQLNDTSFIDSEVQEYGRECGFCNTQCSYQGGDILCNSGRCVPSFSKLVLNPVESSYKRNESALILLKSMLNRSIHIQKCEDFQLERRASGKWNILQPISCPAENFIRIGPMSEYMFNLDDYNLSLDRYRVKANVLVKCFDFPKSKADCQKNITLVSNEFRIKE